jgi:hypothetical protein
LKHWAMVISTAYYGWGAKDTVSHLISFLGITVTRTTRDSFFKRLTSNHVESFCSLLASRCSGLMVWDNFQWGQELREQRGGRYNTFLIGTVEAAHRVLPFVNRFGFPNRKWDNCNMMMTYDREQSRPFGMRLYESIDAHSPMGQTCSFITTG